MTYLEQLHTQRAERLRRMKAWAENRPIVPAYLVNPPKPLPVQAKPVLKPRKRRPHWKAANVHAKYPPIKAIQEVVADHYGMELIDLLSQRRTGDVITPRHVAMYLSYKLTLQSLPEIGRRFAGRDHTTVLHAVRKIAGMMGQDSELTEAVDCLTNLLKGEDQ